PTLVPASHWGPHWSLASLPRVTPWAARPSSARQGCSNKTQRRHLSRGYMPPPLRNAGRSLDLQVRFLHQLPELGRLILDALRELLARAGHDFRAQRQHALAEIIG